MGYVRVAAGAITIPLAYGVGIWADASGPAGPLIAASVTGVASILLFNTLKLQKQPQRAHAAAKFSFRDQWELVRSNRTLAVFFAATMFAGFGNMLANPLYQIVQVQALNLSSAQIGYSRVAYFAALLLTYLIAGRLLDRFDIRHTLLCGICAYAIVPMLYGLWGTYSAVIIGNAVQGIGEAIWDIGILAFVFRLAPGREGVVFSLHLMLFGVRGTIGPILSTSFSDHLTLMLLLASACGWIGTLLFLGGAATNPPFKLLPDPSACVNSILSISVQAAICGLAFFFSRESLELWHAFWASELFGERIEYLSNLRYCLWISSRLY